MSNPYLSPTQAAQPSRSGKRQLPPTPAEDYRPAGNQFTLRGLFIFMPAACVILAILALVIHEPGDWIGALAVPLICSMLIVAMEICRKLFPPRPHFNYYLPPLPPNPLQTAYFGEGGNPFASGINTFIKPVGTTPFSQPPEIPSPPAQSPLEQNE